MTPARIVGFLILVAFALCAALALTTLDLAEGLLAAASLTALGLILGGVTYVTLAESAEA